MIHAQAAAIGVMYLSTMAGAVDPAELAMYAALLMDSDNSEMIEFLMAGMWILLRNPDNRCVARACLVVVAYVFSDVKGVLVVMDKCVCEFGERGFSVLSKSEPRVCLAGVGLVAGHQALAACLVQVRTPPVG